MNAVPKRTLVILALAAVVAGSAFAYQADRSGLSPLAMLEFSSPELEAIPQNARIDDLPQAVMGSKLADLAALGVSGDAGILDTRGGRWRTLTLSRPMIPGNGNGLSWAGLGVAAPADDEALGEFAWGLVRDFVAANQDSLGIDVSELRHRVAVHDGGGLIQIWADRVSGGLDVRGAGFTAVINHGNLILMGAEVWGDIAVRRTPSVGVDEALGKVSDLIAPIAVGALREDPSLVLLPSRIDGDFDLAAGYDHRLAWVLRPEIAGDLGQWEGLVDAHSGELLAFRDLNHYGTARTISGGVYPIAYDGIAPDGNMVQGYPMPYADLSTGGFTDAGGNFDAAGSVTTTLTGDYINIAESCGAISESGTGDIDLEGNDGEKDCSVPAGHSAGDTAAARSGFYELNRMAQQARGLLPGNGWLMGTLTAQMNISNICNAFWTGSVVQFFKETFPCGNTGQLAGVFDHEWGHGMDDNDNVPTIPSSSQGGGEGVADIYAALRLNQACVGRGFFINGQLCGGYGDPCTVASGCTGIRSVDWADRSSGVPHTLTWVRANCGTTVHCLGAAYSEAVWDILKRDLPSIYGMDNNTALEVTTRLMFIGGGNSSGWFDRLGGGPGAAGCGATQAYLQFLAADDDDGNLGNGTPHMQAIAAAFDRHEIGCTPPNGGPTVQDSGCGGTPTTAPVVSVTSGTQSADLSWGAIAGASEYEIYRTDGEHACDFGKQLVGSTAGTSFLADELMDGREYYFVVVPKGPADSCFGPASACTPVVPGGGGGGGIPCEDIRRFQNRCIPAGQGNLLQGRILLTDTSHDGESVTFTVDGNPIVTTVDGSVAQWKITGAASGGHTVELTDPAGCYPTNNVTCP
jgi:hypothetical protein